ncbi:hypothetical protein QZH41_012799, partial [Actinostola sp. cb2023]
MFSSTARCSSTRPIRRVYVIRRSLKILSFHYCTLAHSGLILEMTDGKQCILEYMDDGRSHLYDANPTSTTNCWPWYKRCKKLVMKDDKGNPYTWTRQKYGTSTSLYPAARVTPQVAQRQMQARMGSNYDLVTNNCHLGQERLRRKWGMRVPNSYSPKLKSLCSRCRYRFPSIVLPQPLRGLILLAKAYC